MSLSSTFTGVQKATWEQAKPQALAKCRKLGLTDSAILYSLARYLKATNFQITLAIQRIMDYSFWMKSINSAEDIERFYPINQDYFDSKGRVACIHMVGQMNELELAQVESHMSLVHGIALQLTQIANKAEQAILIVDLKKIRVKTFSNKMVNTALKKIIGLSLQYFPDFLYKGFIVNAPMSFSQVWDSYSTLLPPATLAKIRVIGGPSDPEITSLVPLTMLPETMGGSWNASAECAEEDEPGYGEEPEEIKGEDNAAKLSELKQMIMGKFPHLTGEKVPVGGHKVMIKGKTVELPQVSATPVNTLVEEEDDNDMGIEHGK